MELSVNNGIQADSTAQQTNSLNLSRPVLDFGGVDAFRVDSSRIEVKKPAPVIKTVPYIPENDTINHPVFDVLTGDFVITGDESLISHLRLNPIEPVDGDTQTIQAVNPPREALPVRQQTTAQTELLRQAPPVQAAEPAADTAVAEPLAVADADTASIADTAVVATDSAAVQVVERKVFEEKEGKPLARMTDGFIIDRAFSETDWMIGIIITSFVLFAWTRMIYGKFVGMVLQAAANFFTANRIYNETNVVRTRVYALLNLLFFINIGLFTCQCMSYFGFSLGNYTGWIHFCICVVAFISVYAARSIVLKIADFIFDTDGFGAYNFSVYLFSKVYGLFLLPIVAVIPFVPDVVTEKLIWCGIGLFVLFYILTLFRGLRICLRKGVSIFYLFFYLCALEILPILTIYKVILKYLL